MKEKRIYNKIKKIDVYINMLERFNESLKSRFYDEGFFNEIETEIENLEIKKESLNSDNYETLQEYRDAFDIIKSEIKTKIYKY